MLATERPPASRNPRRSWLRRRNRWRWLAAALALLLPLGYGVPCLLAVHALTHRERKTLSSNPGQLGLRYEDVTFQARDDHITLRGWWIPGAGAQTVILVHGLDSIRDDPTYRFLDFAADLSRAGYTVLTFDLRGHGESQAAPFALGLNEWRDVLGAVDFAAGRGVAPAQIALIGFSAGGASVLGAAARESGIGAVVADGVWPDLRQLLDGEIPKQSGLPGFYRPGIYLTARLLYGIDVDRSKPVNDVRDIAAAGRPLLLIHEADDKHVSPQRAAELDAAAATDPRASAWLIADTPHVKGYLLHPREYDQRILAFLRDAFGTTTP